MVKRPPGAVFRDRPVRHGGRAAAFSTLQLNQDERNALMEIAMPTKQLVTEEEDAAPDDDAPSPKRRKASPSHSANHISSDSYRKGHNAIEKRYRSKLNAQISSLEQCLPVQNIPEDEKDLKPVRTTKSTILIRAINHIEFLQQSTGRLTLETEKLSKRSMALEKLVFMSVEERAEK